MTSQAAASISQQALDGSAGCLDDPIDIVATRKAGAILAGSAAPGAATAPPRRGAGESRLRVDVRRADRIGFDGTEVRHECGGTGRNGDCGAAAGLHRGGLRRGRRRAGRGAGSGPRGPAFGHVETLDGADADARDGTLLDLPTDLPDPGDETTAGDANGDESIAADPIPGDVDPETLPLSPVDTTPPVQLPDGVSLRVATLNVYGFHFATPEEIGAWLGGQDADLAMLEEIGADTAARVATAAGFPYLFAGGGDEALLSKTPLDGPAEVPLVDGRGLIHATTVVEDVTFSVYAAHISWHVEGNLQARQIAREVMAADPLPHLVLAGDFNDEHYSTQNNYLDEVLTDAATSMGWYPGQHITWPSTGFDETEGAQTIDLVFFRKALPAIVKGLAVLNLSPVLSDHKPVVADLLYPREDLPFASDPLAAGRDPFAAFPPAGTRTPNLLVNPGAEDGLSGWDVGGGAQAAATCQQLAPRTGTALFKGFDTQPDPGVPWSWATQVVDLSSRAAPIDAGRGRLYASAWLATGYRTVEKDGEVSNLLTTYSDGEVIVETLDATGVALSRTVSGRRDTLAWHPFAAVVDVPPGARAARVTWMSHYKSQGGDADTAAVDDLYLGFEEVATAHRVLGGTLVPGGGKPGDPRRWRSRPAGPRCRTASPWDRGASPCSRRIAPRARRASSRTPGSIPTPSPWSDRRR